MARMYYLTLAFHLLVILFRTMHLVTVFVAVHCMYSVIKVRFSVLAAGVHVCAEPVLDVGVHTVEHTSRPPSPHVHRHSHAFGRWLLQPQ